MADLLDHAMTVIADEKPGASARQWLDTRDALTAINRALEPLNQNQRARVLAASAIILSIEGEVAEILNQ
jgi:hypothetical protein